MEIDLHGYELWKAIEEIIYKLEECQANGIREISLVHGFHKGQILKNYIQSERFLKEMEKEGFQLKKKSNPNPGVSAFLIL